MTTPQTGRGADGDALKAAVFAEIDRRADEIVAFSDTVMRAPESGYREETTARRVAERFAAMGLEFRERLALTGVKARMRGRTSRRTVAVIGELDSLIVPGHPYADPATGAAHACGHNAQLASMLGAGLGLAPVMDRLDGDVVLFAVPAEECIEVGWRLDRRDAGDVEFILGKAELIRLGEFDDVDLAMMTHSGNAVADPAVTVACSANGSLVKRVVFRGRSAHAGATPELGVNALKAALLAVAAIDAQRDTFKDADAVRVSQIITAGGDAVSAVPAEARMEMMVRARTVEAMADASGKVDRALRAGALALGAEVEIETVSGYLPLATDAPLDELLYANCARLYGPDLVRRDTGPIGGSTDMGDLGHLMPVGHPMAASGNASPFHGPDYHVVDHVLAAVEPAKFMAATVIDLLRDGAAEADRVIAACGPKLKREAYLELRRGLEGRESFTS
ncbi:MAG: amidohydrolase [Streptomycetaceae bacterium]|nr:amidohydrolase [Streptomycetaceae bacterium]